MTSSPARSVSVVGSKVAALTPEVIYNVAHGRFHVEPDSSSLEQFSSKKTTVALSILPRPEYVSLDGVELLSDVEVRATLVVLLHRLLIGAPGSRKFLPSFIAEVLNLGFHLDIPADSESAGLECLIGGIYRVREASDSVSKVDETAARELLTGQETSPVVLAKLKEALENSGTGEIGVTLEERIALQNCYTPAIGIAALAAYSVNSLTVVADAVAALSCEALRANTESFTSDSYKQAFARKSEAEVASDLNSLLSGSKLVKARKGGVDGEFIRSLPVSLGNLRDAAKLLAPRIRIEINLINQESSITDDNLGFLETAPCLRFTSILLPLFVNLLPNISGSLQRTHMCLEVVRDLSLDSNVLTKDWKDESTEVIAALKQSLREVAGTTAVSGDEKSILLAREVLSAVETWRRAISKECTSALALLSVRESLLGGRAPGQEIGESRVKENKNGDRPAGTNAKQQSTTPPRSSKIKSEFVLGRGTDIMRDAILGYINERYAGVEFKTAEFLSVFEEKLNGLLYPHVPELKAIISKVKNVLESNEIRRLPKIAKGTRDFKPEQMAIREKAFGIIAAIFKRHGAAALDTPVFELRETLMGKYGEDSKLIYDLADQGGEMLSLRYDLTVPFARYLAMNKVENLKRYHIAKVYRRDNPAKGRYREFYQCDLDIAGQYALMVPDFEVLKVLTELLNELNIGDYEVKLNHRKLLDGILDICGVPQSKFRTICSAIDKLDKLAWELVCKEMVEEKGLAPEVADKIGVFVQKRGSPLVLLEELKQTGGPFLHHTGSTTALEELGVLFKYLQKSKCLDHIVFDLSLARGLDYYTGVIYEAVLKGSNQVGSIAAGGRYDNLVGMFSGKQVPAVGVSLGIERVFAIMEKQDEDRKRIMRVNQTDVLVLVLGKDQIWTEVAIEIVTELWDGRLNAEFACIVPGKITQQITKAGASGIPWVVIVGEDEIKNGVLQLKDIVAGVQEKVPRDSLVKVLQSRLGVAVELPIVVQ